MCVLWAAEKGELGTIEQARRYCDADLNANGTRDYIDMDRPWSKIPGRLEYFATPLHIAIHRGHQHIVQYLLDNNVNVHVESRGLCGCDDSKDTAHGLSYTTPWYPLHTALNHSRISGATEQLIIQGGAYLVAPYDPVLPILERKGAQALVKKLLNNETPQAMALALHYTVQFNKTGPFRRLVKIPGIGTTASDGQGWTALHWASRAGKIKFVRGLLEAGADPEAGDIRGYTPMHFAAENGHVDILKLLLNTPGINAAKATKWLITPLHLAASEGNEAVVKLLAERPEVNVSAEDKFAKTPLHLAVTSKKQKDAHSIIRSLIDHRALVDHSSHRTYTALFTAIKHRRFKVAMTLLSCGSDPLHHQNSPRGGWTVLHECLRRPAPRQRELVAALIAKGADANALVDKDTALEEFARDEAYWRAETNRDTPKGDPSRQLICRCTPLYLATVGAGDIECMKLLLASGARTNDRIWGSFQGDPFNPPLNFHHGGPELLLACVIRHFWGMLCIIAEEVHGAADRICLLLEHGARIDDDNDSDNDNEGGVGRYYPLRYACRYAMQGDSSLLKLLLDCSDKTNVSLQNIEDVRATFDWNLRQPYWGDIVDRIQSFIDREYPNADSGL